MRPDRGKIYANAARHIGQRVRVLRDANGITQEMLGTLCGVTRETIRAIEAGEQIPKGDTLMALAAWLTDSVEDLLPPDYADTFGSGGLEVRLAQIKTRRRTAAKRRSQVRRRKGETGSASIGLVGSVVMMLTVLLTLIAGPETAQAARTGPRVTSPSTPIIHLWLTRNSPGRRRARPKVL